MSPATNRETAGTATRTQPPASVAWLDHLPCGAALADGEGRLIGANAQAKTVFGLAAKSKKTPALTSLFRLLNRNTREEVAVPVASFLTRAKPVRRFYKTLLVSARGSETLVNATFSACRIAARTERGMLMLFDNVGEFDNRERIERGRQEMEMIGAMARNIAEQFGPHIQAISSYAGSMTENLLPNTHAHEQALKILAAVENIGDIAKRLTGLTEIAEPNRPLAIEDVPLGEVVGNAITLSQNIRPHSKGSFSIRDIQLMSYVVHADAAQLLDALFNIFEEIDRAAPLGSKISLGIGKERGISKNRVLLRIYEQTGKSSIPGEEMISRVRANTDEWGGELHLTHSAARGVVYSLLIPLSTESKTKSGATRTANKQLALLADDNENVRHQLADTLTKAGYEVVCARNGNECHKLYCLLHKKIGITILDALMPGKNARHIVRAILTLDPTAAILIVSGFSRDYVRGQIEQGQWGFIQKPIDPREFLDRVERMLDHREQRQSVAQKRLFKR